MGSRLKTALLSLQEIAAGVVVMGTPKGIMFDASGAKIWVRFGRRAATALTASINFRIEISPDSSGNTWETVKELSTQLGSSVADQIVNGTVAIGATVITLADTTGFVAGDDIFIENTVPANSEWAKIKSISGGVSVTIEEALINAQTGSTVFDQAERYTAFSVDLKGLAVGNNSDSGSGRIRAVADGSGGGQAFACEVIMVEWS
ncbi:hypothetical protein LCGC14_1061890 [marine sediment metagenome]|uniref:Uncharacterized protein n=1 Tax=marine sediment metagenome TaxID=412755 RepID=A0A0F9MKY4_9ZZZZ